MYAKNKPKTSQKQSWNYKTMNTFVVKFCADYVYKVICGKQTYFTYQYYIFRICQQILSEYSKPTIIW